MKIITELWQTLTAGLIRIQRPATLDQLTRSAYQRWAINHPDWASAFFDEHFLQQRARPYLQAVAEGEKVAEPLLLAGIWADQFRLPAARRQQRVAAVLPAAKEFLAIWQGVIGDQKTSKHWYNVPFGRPLSLFQRQVDFPCPEQAGKV